MFGRLLLLLTLLLLPWQAHAAEKLRLTNGDWPPLLGEKLKHHGVLSRVVKEAFALEGIEVEYGFFPWKRAMELARHGDWDGTIVWHKTEAREPYFLFSEPVFYDKTVFFHRTDTQFEWEDFEDLVRYSIGITLGYSYGEQLDRLAAEGKLNIQQAATDELNLKKLLGGRIDAFACNIEIGYYLLRSRFAPGTAAMVTNHPRFLFTAEGQRVLISRKVENAKRYIDAFNRGFQKLKDSGKYELYLMESRRGDYLR